MIRLRVLSGLVIVALGVGACQPSAPLASNNIPTPAAESISANLAAPSAPPAFKLGLVVFLTGSAAKPFGLPAQAGAQVIIEAINQGQAPAPYDTPGLGGVQIEPIFVDEAGGADKQVSELRRLYTQENVDAIIGYISSTDCLAVAPEAEDLQKLLVAFDCGTSRLFEERDYTYVFRTNAHQAIDSIAGARYLLKTHPEVTKIAGINQNYAWGQDSWAHFRDTLLKLNPAIQIVNEQFPPLNAGGYITELAALAQAQPEMIHSSFWGGDLNTLLAQSVQAGLWDERHLLLSVGEYALPELADQTPAGTIIGAHGPHGVLAPANPLNDWLIKLYTDRYHTRPTYPVYHMAQAILGLKMAYEKAQSQTGERPTPEQIAAAFTHLTYPTPSGDIALSIGRGHQAVEPAAYGTAGRYDPRTKEVMLENVIVYPAECVNPPDDMTTEQWIREGFPGARCP